MRNDNGREAQRQVYRQPSMGVKVFIPAKPKIDIYGSERIFRVCAYCRVSTDNDAQLSSFELQQAHYQQLVGSHPNWDLKRIYADEGISGTSPKKRDDFNAMIAACEAGEYDLIVTKSVSRFARNLVDCVSLVRKLKRQKPPVGVYFETDNLNTLSEDSELMLSFFATFAQEESVKKSESMNWSLRQRFRDGKLLTPALLGYERPRDVTGRYIKYAKLEIIESEAEIVRFIQRHYPHQILPKKSLHCNDFLGSKCVSSQRSSAFKTVSDILQTVPIRPMSIQAGIARIPINRNVRQKTIALNADLIFNTNPAFR